MIKRIGLLLVAALMAAMMMVATAAPAFALPGGLHEVKTHLNKGGQEPEGNAFGVPVVTEVCNKPEHCPAGQNK